MVRIEDLRIEVRGKVLLDGLSLTLGAGERCTITGPSGSGKSTIMRCLLGFAEPAGGRIELFGEALDAGNVWSMRQRIAWVPQEPELGAGTAREAIEAPFRLRANKGHKPGGERTAALAERLQLDAGVLDQEVADLSGGEKQRVALMIALLLDRPLLLLDEVTSAMDGERRDVVLACLRELEDTAIVSVSHDPERFHVGGAVLALDGREGANGSG